MLLFEKAKPIWIKDMEKEINIRAQFRAVTECTRNGNTCVKIATSGIYNLFVNNKFVCYGPARAGRNHFRMDRIDISDYLVKGSNIIVIETAGYYVNSYYIQEQESFLQCEIQQDEQIIAYTGDGDFEAFINPCYIRKIQRYSFQRPMIEAYKMDCTYDEIFTSVNTKCVKHEISVQPDKNIIERYAPYPLYEITKSRYYSNGTVDINYRPAEYIKDRSLDGISNTLHGFKESELDVHLTDEGQNMRFTESPKINAGDEIEINGLNYVIYELPFDSSGMISFNAEASSDCTIYIMFDEILINNDVNFQRLGCANIVKYELRKGSYKLKLFEVYTMKYIKIVVTSGCCKISNPYIIEYKHPPVNYSNEVISRDPELIRIYNAALESYRQNAVDLFTDCPSRERAGWLCDSFFTSRVEKCLTGDSRIEKSFLENFLHDDVYEGLPEGMLPMCYPADHIDGVFIPNWAMWLVYQLKEYYIRTNDRALIDRFKDKVYGLLNYFNGFENQDGLLERLASWVFVEWSHANGLTQDVNYPSNMLYYGILKAAGELYNDSGLISKAGKVKEEILKQSYNGEFFVDNAVRNDKGELVLSGETTEVCQYYAFFFEIVTPDTHPSLFTVLLNDFGPDRKKNNKYPNVHFANAFIGNYMRLDILSKYGYMKEVLDNIKGYFLYMADRTGTLWEHDNDSASCNHGFASHVIYWLDKMKA